MTFDLQRSVRTAAPLILSLAFLVSPSSAQVLPRGVGWADISRPEFDPIGIRAGSFDVYPKLQAVAEYNSNVFARAEDVRADAVLTIRPEIEANSTWSVHRLDFSAFIESSFYPSIDDEGHTDVGLRTSGAYEISGATVLSAEAGYAYIHEDRGDIDTAFTVDGPIGLDRIDASLGLTHRFNKLQVGIRGGYDRFNYDDGLLADATVVDQDFRDRTQMSAQATARYALSPEFGFYVSAGYKDVDNDFSRSSGDFIEGLDLERDFDEINTDAGIAVEITDVLYATLGVGYFTARFDDPLFDNENGLRVRGDLLWNISSITTIRADVARETQAASSPIAPIRVNTSIDLGVDHELLYNLILTADARYQIRDFDPIDRTDDEYRFGLSGLYLLSNLARVRFAYVFERRDSPIAVFDYTRHRVSLTAELTY
ncbi:MAG: outer membrane beta-barrel protein [Pseudomonadota bacterium]